MRCVWFLVALLCLSGCATVRPEDLAAWKGRPVADLDKHPVFATMRLVRSHAADGTEIRNYVNGTTGVSCSGTDSGQVIGSTALVNQSGACISSTPACINIFHVNNGVFESYTPIGTGGARCYTDERAQPAFRGATNVR
jgi:hypothetical protein